MKTFQEFITERSDLPGNTGGSSNRLQMPAPKPAPGGASDNKVTINRGGKGPRKSFMQSINSNARPSLNTSSKAPSLNVNPSVKHSSRTATPGANSKYGEGSVAKSHRGLI